MSGAVDAADWDAVVAELDAVGGALLPRLLSDERTVGLRELYGREELFRSTIDMERYRFGAGDWNALHRDLYGDLVFPLQVVIALNDPGVDHEGGEFLLLEQRPRAQSRGTSFTLLPSGHGFVFTTRDRPVRSARGWSAAPVRHGVSTVRSGSRHTLARVFHDAA
ncbi:2OG-Fe(II) oxygenase [Tsukamurella ocularis]|uniref:2OG-Fe(II) oxygenase n=1 Tax=Tsukamurella ocularis TaxID=1970234 RepID=UPI0021694272|nr:2OG-Fe(II) oxygenase [Tsukamurella ocularis]MCS3778609.1 hypothetical protein [Tsukamurella ocularis]MCS3789310.1 hypothetical protein [Tsukamurella ocularis]MCS3851292.1 hypothetical protein [Tsukamurella ocularis]